MVDFTRPDGTAVMRSIADYRQFNDALFHAGTRSGSQFEWEDTPNRLHFYVIGIERDDRGILNYTLGVKSLDGRGPQTRGVTLTAPAELNVAAGQGTMTSFTLGNTGTAAPVPDAAHPTNVSRFADVDIYRVSATVEGTGWSVTLPNALTSAAFGAHTSVPVFVARGTNASDEAVVTVTATSTSESDPSKTTAAAVRVR